MKIVFTLINTPTRVTKSSPTIVDHVLTNTIIYSKVPSGKVKTNKSNPFAVFALMKISLLQTNIKNTITKRDTNEDGIINIKSVLNSVYWNLITQTSTPYSFYIFFDKFVKICDSVSRKKNWNETKQNKKMSSPWSNNASTKRKQIWKQY